LDSSTFSHHDKVTDECISVQSVSSDVSTTRADEWMMLFQQPAVEIITSVFRHNIFIERLGAEGFRYNGLCTTYANDDIENMEVQVCLDLAQLHLHFYSEYPSTVVEISPHPLLKITHADEMLHKIEANVLMHREPRSYVMGVLPMQPAKPWWIRLRFQRKCDIDALLEIISIIRREPASPPA
jgi:hypothetical protein